MGSEGIRILITAGEASGDQAGAPVVAALKRLRPDWTLLATGGERMAAAGADLRFHYRELAVMGFSEVLRKLPAIRSRFNTLAAELAGGEVDLFLPVDFPGFNLRLAARARRAGVPVLCFIAPQVWAWGERRVEKMRRDIDRLAVILPFERAWFAERGIDAEFVGHPIMDEDRPQASMSARVQLGILPGSRAQEVRRLLEPMLAAASMLRDEMPGLQVEILESPGLGSEFYAPWREEGVRFCREPAASFLARQGAALVASGTAALETAVAGLPMVVAYRTGWINYWLARRLVSLDRIALANLVAGRLVVPEFVQGRVDSHALAAAARPLLMEGEDRSAQLEGLGEIRAKLGSPGCGERVARMAIELVEDRR